ncbi:maestro heat-like repeat family member 5 [Tiliqua scincoides]|uniref:maestro heat-like repeat family member 5 n=1 Tax=Tiliqua scincoides TaxID=71010 RepID=UPI0034626AF4
MTSFLKKFQLLKKKSTTANDSAPEDHRAQQDPREASRNQGRQQPSTSTQDPAYQRTSQLLPLLVKPPQQSTLEAKKKLQTQTLALPELPGTATSRGEQAHRLSLDGNKQQITLPKLPAAKTKRSSPVLKKKGPEGGTPVFPELSDEQFRYLWDAKKLQRAMTVKEAVDMMDEREVLNTILAHLQRPPPLALYKYFGVKLREVRQKELLGEYLLLLLRLSSQEEDRDGISEAVGLVAFYHLSEILVTLREYAHLMAAKRALQTDTTLEEQKNLFDKQTRTTLLMCYGQAANGAKPEDVFPLVEHIVSEILFQFRGDHKDEVLKKSFLRAVVMISKALQFCKNDNVQLPHKTELVVCIVEVIEEEPLGSFSITVLHQAILTINCLTYLKPPMDLEVRSDLVSKSVQKVFSLPSLKMTKLKAGSPTHPTQTQDFYQQTIGVCNTMLINLLSEIPNINTLQDILVHTNDWIESQKSYERERAVRTTQQLLKFVSEHLDFDISQEFYLLGQLLALLALHINDSVKDIGQQAAEALYYLHYITMSKMAREIEMRRKNKKGMVVKWYREDFFISGPSVFSNNISKVAKAFGEHLSPTQISQLALRSIDNLPNEDKAISQGASVLLSSFLEECGMDIEDLPMIIKEVYHHLPLISDPVTKEETLKAVCNLASKRLNGVVDVLLECSLDCDDTVAEIWKALVYDPYSNIKLLRPLLKRLQDEDPSSEICNRRHSKSVMPLAATNALCLILSLPEAADVIQGKFSHLLIALVTQIYFVLGTGRRGSRKPSNADTLPSVSLSSAIQALKNLTACAGYIKEYNILGMQGCWDMLATPEQFFDGIFHLIRTLFAFSKLHLKMAFKQANAYLRRPDVKERTVGMAFFTELLYHSEIGLLFVKQDILDVLREWMVQSCPLMQVFSIRGLGYLLQHSFEDEVLEPFLSPLLSYAFDPDRNIAKESIKTLQRMFRHLDVEEYGSMGTNLIPHLLQYFDDEDNELRCSSIGLFGMLLKGVKDNNKQSMREEVFQSFVPLLIRLTDHWNKEIARDTLVNCFSYLKWADVPKDTFEIESHISLFYTYGNICKHIIRKNKLKLPEMVAQMVEYLKSKSHFSREAAAILIGCNAQYMKLDVMTSKEVEKVYLALRELEHDSEPTVVSAAVRSVEELLRHCGSRINPHIVSN